MKRTTLLVLGLALAACDDEPTEPAQSAETVEHADHDHASGSGHSAADAGHDDEHASREHEPAAQSGAGDKAGAGGKGGYGGAGGKGGKGGKGGMGGMGGASEDADAGREQPDAAEPDATAAESGATDITVRFQAKLGDKDFACGADYAAQGTQATTVTPQDMRLFIQDLALIREDGTRVPVQNETRAPWQSETVALLDFEDATGNCAGTSETNREITGSIAAGTYTGLRFAVGVPKDLNHSDATMLADPLKTSASLSWSWLSGFRFAKIELAKKDTETFGEGGFHPGSQACTGNPAAGEVTCGKPNRNEVVLDDFDASKHSVVIDVGALFANTDLSSESVCHSGDRGICGPMFDAWGIDFEDGTPKSGQTVFKKSTETP
jgi:uncharacterized repeat protein (TIGR04052 family)